jgi:hypothetical protein
MIIVAPGSIPCHKVQSMKKYIVLAAKFEYTKVRKGKKERKKKKNKACVCLRSIDAEQKGKETVTESPVLVCVFTR